MDRINFCKDINVSVFSLGCMRIAGKSDKERDSLINTALSLGINHFDHADIYGGGECETVFGKFLAENPWAREKMVIQSKCGIRKDQFDFSKEHIIKSVEGSLSRLQTDSLDTLLLHRPDALMEPQEVAEAFSELEKSGKVKSFGVSNFNPMQLKLLQSAVKQKLSANQLQFSLMHTGMIDFGINTNTKFEGSVNRDGSILDYCRMEDITVQAWSPYQYGFFEGVFIDNEKFPQLNKALEEVGEAHNISKSAVASAWILRHPAKMQVILGTTNTDRLKEICKAAEISLSRSEWYKLYIAAGNKLP